MTCQRLVEHLREIFGPAALSDPRVLHVCREVRALRTPLIVDLRDNIRVHAHMHEETNLRPQVRYSDNIS